MTNPTNFDVDAIIVGGDEDERELYLDIGGPPLVQQRLRVAFLRFIHPRLYDPSGRSKRALKRAVRNALVNVGNDDFPVFQNSVLEVQVTFFVSNPNKDIDNLAKFLLDALEGVIYSNDRLIWDLVAKKRILGHPLQFTRVRINRLTAL